MPSPADCWYGCRHVGQMRGFDGFAFCEDQRPTPFRSCLQHCTESAWIASPDRPRCWLKQKDCYGIAANCSTYRDLHHHGDDQDDTDNK